MRLRPVPLLALPDWAETSRVVNAYTEALGLDGRPILRRMALQLSPDTTTQRSSRAAEPAAPDRAAAPVTPPQPTPPPAPAAPPVATPAREPAPPQTRDDIEAFDQFDPLRRRRYHGKPHGRPPAGISAGTAGPPEAETGLSPEDCFASSWPSLCLSPAPPEFGICLNVRAASLR